MAFSLNLTEEQLDLQKWVHGFATDVLRPAAAEWDEREELPWPVLEEAARIGMYSWEALTNSSPIPPGC
jgi:acyl-CoA dehydrogenase